jgi:DNA-binding GntR family transcriptional regulator
MSGWSGGAGPLYRQLAASVRTAIAMGDIAEHLPSERDLAVDLGVSRTTAVAAYDLLVEEGVLVRRGGSGTFVARRPRRSPVCEDPLDCVQEFFDAARGR